MAAAPQKPFQDEQEHQEHHLSLICPACSAFGERLHSLDRLQSQVVRIGVDQFVTGTLHHITYGRYHAFSDVIPDQDLDLTLGHIRVDVEAVISTFRRSISLSSSFLWCTIGSDL